MALVHEPRILFLDEPTTGLDPQSRAALWEEVARLAHEEGITVFLTTQYLEEADALADRIGIIDHGKIVAEGSPAKLKAEIGSPSVAVQPVDPRCRRALGGAPEPLRRAPAQRPRNRRPSSCRAASPSSPRSCGYSTATTCGWSRCSCTSPPWTTCSSPRPGASSRAPARNDTARVAARTGRGRREALGDRHLPAACTAGLPDGVPADPVRDQRQRAQQGGRHPGLPDPQLPGVPARDAVRAGRDVRRRSPPGRAWHATSRPAS